MTWTSPKRSHSAALLFSAMLGLAACREGGSAGSDPNALYGYLNGKHVFIMSHVFDARVYQESFNQPIQLNPDVGGVGSETLFTCFYELQLANNELDACTSTLGSDLTSNNVRTNLTTSDVWKLMVLRDDKLTGLTDTIVLRDELVRQAQTNWSQVERVRLLTSAESQDANLRLSAPDNDQLQLVDLGALGRNALGWLKNGWNNSVQQGKQSLACLAVKSVDPQQNPGVLDGIRRILGLGDRPLVNGILTGALGEAVPFVTRMLGNLLGAENVASDRCARSLVNAAANPRSIVNLDPVNPNALREAIKAIERDDAESLRKVLDDELKTSLSKLDHANFEMRDTLADSLSGLTDKGLHKMRESIRILGGRAGQRTAGAAIGSCISPKTFAQKVLVPSLNDVRKTLGDSVASRQGCASVPGAQTATTTPDLPATPSQERTDSSSAAEISDLKRQLAELNKQLAAKRNEVLSQPSSAPESAGPGSGAGETVASVLRNYSAVAPASCAASNPTIANLETSELSSRLESCKAFGNSDETHTFGRFSDSLRAACVAQSAGTPGAAATCLCSCRWSSAFYRFLMSRNQ